MKYTVGDYDLRDIQNVMLEMLADIDRVCRENGIRYVLDGGSMLGAVRHKGFIPWDDDLDIAMVRDDYIKFIEVANKELDNKYRFECIENTKEYPYNFGKVFNVKTTYTEEFTAKLDIGHGVYIDVFPMDYVDISHSKRLASIRKMIGKLTQARYAKLKISAGGKKDWMVKCIPLRFINYCANKLMTYNYKNKGEYVQKLCHFGKNKPPINTSIFTDTIRVPYETHAFPVPREYDSFLRGRYGDYMQLPPEEQQKPVHKIVGVKL